MSHPDYTSDAQKRALLGLRTEGIDARPCGSAGLEYLAVARGDLDAVAFNWEYAWDHAAGLLLVDGGGRRPGDALGRPVPHHRRQRPALHGRPRRGDGRADPGGTARRRMTWPHGARVCRPSATGRAVRDDRATAASPGAGPGRTDAPPDRHRSATAARPAPGRPPRPRRRPCSPASAHAPAAAAVPHALTQYLPHVLFDTGLGVHRGRVQPRSDRAPARRTPLACPAARRPPPRAPFSFTHHAAVMGVAATGRGSRTPSTGTARHAGSSAGGGRLSGCAHRELRLPAASASALRSGSG